MCVRIWEYFVMLLWSFIGFALNQNLLDRIGRQREMITTIE